MSETVKTHLANHIELAEAKAQLDENVKQFLGNKQILAWIFKYTVEEFKDYELIEIENCIEGEPEIGTHPVYPGKGKAEAITGMNTHSKIPNEGEINFDVRCYAITKGKERVKLILNLEAQKEYYVDYPWILRGLFYSARMVSEQKDTEFSHSDYGNLKRVYSIWIFMESPNYAAHTISTYTIQHNSVYGEYEERERYDLMNVVAVRLAVDKNRLGGHILHQMLETVFSHSMNVKEKTQKLEQDFGMRMLEEVEEGAISMCNYSDWIEEKGIKKGEENILMDQIKKKLTKNMTIEEIADVLETDIHVIEKLIARIE